MIFVVVGTQEPFDRLIKHIDEWSIESGYNEIYAQISKASYKPSNFEWVDFLPPHSFDIKFKEANIIVGHAGMGTIISALQYSKPIIIMPRLVQYKEHRNDHQLATARSFGKLGYVNSVFTKEELFKALYARNQIPTIPPISNKASMPLLKIIHDFIKP